MYMEAVTARLQADGSEVVDVADRHLADVTLVYCDTAEDWELLADVLPNPAVAVLPSFDINGFIRALRKGARNIAGREVHPRVHPGAQERGRRCPHRHI